MNNPKKSSEMISEGQPTLTKSVNYAKKTDVKIETTKRAS